MATRINKPELKFLVAVFGGLAAGMALAAPEGRLDNADGSAWIEVEQPQRFSRQFMDDDRFSGRMSIRVRPWDVGKSGELYLAARVDEAWFMKSGGRWMPWDGRVASLEPAEITALGAAEEVAVLDGQALPAGAYTIYSAYRPEGGALVPSRVPLEFQVRSAASVSLQRFASPEAMEAYIKEALANGAGDQDYLPYMAMRSASPTLGDTARASSTNAQTAGVDEADTVKTDGETLFALQTCEYDDCLAVYALDPEQPAAEALATYALKGETNADGLYLLEERDLLLTVGGRNAFGHWFDIWGWSNNRTEVEFFDAADPAALVSREKLSLDGSLVASRVVDDTLYLVTRYTPSIEGFNPFPLARDEERDNEALLARAALPELLPQARDSRGEVLDLVRSRDCYLSTGADDDSLNPSIITITSVPLDAPTDLRSTCFVGGSETLYMTPDSLYLATTSQDYRVLARDALVYDPDHRTAIHKFALEDGAIEYRGSGAVEGHLGWNEDYKSYRMGENGDYLNVVTSIGDTWNGTASTQLHVLKEGAGDTLEHVGSLTGIGKPGEQLHAARFLGDRAFLVTFRLTDPLYMVDLSDQEDPRLAGALEAQGYSDYLHPVSGNLLLGIGKDAVPDTAPESAGDEGRGAFAQGVKLSLFDVSDAGAMREIDSLVLGKRGSETPVSWDPHAFTFLPAADGEALRLAIPVQLHDRVPAWDGFDASSPDAWYDYTHTALYSFEASELGIARAGRLVGSEAGAVDGDQRQPVVPLTSRMILPWFPTYGDRAVLVDDAVFYLHDGKLLSARWGESR